MRATWCGTGSTGPTRCCLSLSPLSHHIAWVGVAQWLLAGCRFVTNDPPPGKSALDWIVDTGATYVMGVPTHAMDVLAEQKARGLARLGAVSVFYMAGAPIPPSVAAAFVAQGIRPQNVYGMTENSSHQYTHPGDDTDTIVATCGRGGPAYEVRLFDPADRDREVAVGEVGEIGGRGALLMLGYFDNQAATEASFNRDGWFMSGDLGVHGRSAATSGSSAARRTSSSAAATTSILRISRPWRCGTPRLRGSPAFRWRTSGWASACASPSPAASRRTTSWRISAARVSPSTTCRSFSCGSTRSRSPQAARS